MEKIDSGREEEEDGKQFLTKGCSIHRCSFCRFHITNIYLLATNIGNYSLNTSMPFLRVYLFQGPLNEFEGGSQFRFGLLNFSWEG